MKKIFLFTSLILSFYFCRVDALEAKLDCSSKELIINDIFDCKVYVNSGEDSITSFKSNLSYSSKDFELVAINPSNNWISNSTKTINLSNDSDELNGEEMLATLQFKVKSTTDYGKKAISLSEKDLTDTVSDKVKIVSTNNLLSTLTISGKSFSFNANQNTYTITNVTTNSVTVSANLQDSRAKFDPSHKPGVYDLNYGDNSIQIIVISESGKPNVYTLNINRTDNRSKNNNLASLTVSNGKLSPEFNANNLIYDASVPSTTKTIEINATLANSKAYFLSGYGPRSVTLKDGLNSILLQIKAENGSTKTYTINVIRSDAGSNTYLKDVKLSSGNIEFNKEILSYKTSVLYDVEEMEVSAITEDSKAKVEIIGNKKLEVGENTYTIKVTAENGSIRTYTIVVTRLEEDEILSSNTYLKKLVVKNYKIAFDSEILEYNLTIKNEKNLTMSYEADDLSSNVRVIGNSNLKNGSVISIIVTAEDGSTKTYKINITQAFPWKTIIIIMFVFIFLAGIILLIVFKDKIFKKKERKIESDVLKDQTLVLNDTEDNFEKTKIYDKKEENIIIPEISEEDMEELRKFESDEGEK